MDFFNGGLRLMMSHWCDLMIDLFHHIEKLALVPTEILSEFQKKDQGKFFSSLIVAKYTHYDVYSTYLNFDLRLSILEDCNLKDDLKEIFKGVDEGTWKQVEFQFVTAQLKFEESVQLFDDFDEIREEFITKASPSTATSVSDMKILLENIIAYIPGVELKGYAYEEDEVLIHFKLLYEMIIFAKDSQEWQDGGFQA
ncbi:hypothetical protein PtA15_1A956 [Puccinia triticina]|nr:uncharacterized protein PtA15_1A956 [Puccinia triticina]WAQ81614.1 hypothetical protein PtA15_1A956 [Puccinia triticina]